MQSTFPQVREVCKQLSDEVSSALKAKRFPIVLGGDYSIAIGTLAGVHSAIKEFGVIWLDAHGDYNTPDITPSGNIHGMSLALSTGEGSKWFPSPPWPKRSVDPEKVVDRRSKAV